MKDVRGVEIDHAFTERTTFVIGKDHKVVATLSSADDKIAPAQHVQKALRNRRTDPREVAGTGTPSLGPASFRVPAPIPSPSVELEFWNRHGSGTRSMQHPRWRPPELRRRRSHYPLCDMKPV